MSDKKVEDLTLLTLRNHKKHKNMQNLSCYYDLKWMFSSMEILNCDGLSQFYFEQPNWLWGISLRTMIIPYLYCARENTSRWESRTSTNSVVLLMCKRENELSDNNYEAQTGVNLLSRHLFYS